MSGTTTVPTTTEEKYDRWVAFARIETLRIDKMQLQVRHFASDLFIDTTQIIQPPIVVASSNWYRPILYGVFGLAAGLLLTFIIAIITIILSISSRRKKKTNPETSQATSQETR